MIASDNGTSMNPDRDDWHGGSGGPVPFGEGGPYPESVDVFTRPAAFGAHLKEAKEIAGRERAA